MKKSVWAVLIGYDYEGDTLMAIFSTQAEAEKEVDSIKEWSNGHVRAEEYVVWETQAEYQTAQA